MAEYYSIEWMCYNSFIQQLMDFLGCFRFGGIMNIAVVNMSVQVFETYVLSICFHFSWGYIPRGGIAGSYGNLMFSVLKDHQTVFRGG